MAEDTGPHNFENSTVISSFSSAPSPELHSVEPSNVKVSEILYIRVYFAALNSFFVNIDTCFCFIARTPELLLRQYLLLRLLSALQVTYRNLYWLQAMHWICIRLFQRRLLFYISSSLICCHLYNLQQKVYNWVTDICFIAIWYSVKSRVDYIKIDTKSASTKWSSIFQVNILALFKSKDLNMHMLIYLIVNVIWSANMLFRNIISAWNFCSQWRQGRRNSGIVPLT